MVIELLRELNRDLWHPFRRHFGALDTDAFVALFAADLIRAGGPDRRVIGLGEYAAQMSAFFTDVAARGDGITIDFRFHERLAADGKASERGVFRAGLTPAGGEPRTILGHFHTFARKTDGRWRFVVDYESDGGTLTDDDFAIGAETDDLERFASLAG